VHKHAAVGIKPAHYPIVARHLLGAIREVLGDAATPELLAAWDEAYWLLAGELIAAEARLYQSTGAEAGALTALDVVRVQPEAHAVTSFYLQKDGGSPGGFEPGQYVSVAVELPGGQRQLRQYSLSAAPSEPYWRISVKREAAGAASPAGQVSSFLHANVAPAGRLLVSAAYGNFTPLRAAGDRPLALLTAGVGITPVLSALLALAERQSSRPILFAHAAQSASEQLFSGELERAAAHLPQLRRLTWHERSPAPGARLGRMQLDAAALAGFEEAQFCLCGPSGFMREQYRALLALGISPLRIEREVFGPDLLEHLR